MSQADRQLVEGTDAPAIYIKHRVYKGRNGFVRASKQWVAEYCVDARQHHLKLSTSNKATAIRMAHELHKKLRNNEPVAPKKKVQISELVSQYMDDLRNRNRAPKTVGKYDFVLKSMVDWASEKNKGAANAITSQDFWAFNKWMADKGLSLKTRYDRLMIIKQLFKWATIKAKLLAENPFAGESVAEPDATTQPCFTMDQVKKLLEEAHPHEAAMYSIMAYAGLRIGEVQQLQWIDVDQPQTGFLNICRGGTTGSTKGKRSRRIPIHDELRKVLDKLPRDFDLVFTARPSGKHPGGGGQISARRLLLSLKRLCKRCKFPNPGQYKLHTFRHAFASMLARSNVSYKYALEFMGHHDSRILDLYYKMFDSTARQAIEMIDYKGEPKRVPAA